MAKSISYYRNKADKLLQEWGRKTYKYCEACGKPLVCLHHYWPKSKASALRYDPENLIPICNDCHLAHHTGNPDIHNSINKLRGPEWQDRLRIKKRAIIKTNITYYKEIIGRLGK